MQVFLDDGTILFADAWALTRVDPKGKVKNLPELFAAPIYPLSCAGTPPSVLTRGKYSYQAKRLDAATLKPIPAHGATPDYALEDGHFIASGRVVSARGSHALSLADPRDTPDATVRFGERGTHRCIPLRARDGVLARFLYTNVGTPLCLYDLRAEGYPLTLEVDVHAPTLSVLDAFPDRDGVTISCWFLHESRATIARVDRSGRETAHVDVAAITLPVIDGARVVSQPDARTVRSTPLDGSAPTDFSIEAISREADARAKAPAPRDNVGPGMVLADRGRTLFVPWHGETLLDLDRKLFIDRKLPAKHAALRASITAYCRDHRDALLRDGYERPASVHESKGRVGLTFWRVPHVPTGVAPLADALASLAQAIPAQTGLSVGSFGSQG
ncbi:MAG: hypothetical protein R3A52_06755 [Polyangiales bacterium]